MMETERALKNCDAIEKAHPDLSPVLDTIRAALKAQEKPVVVAENILYAEWFEDDEDQELDFYEWVFKKKLPNGIKIIEGGSDESIRDMR